MVPVPVLGTLCPITGTKTDRFLNLLPETYHIFIDIYLEPKFLPVPDLPYARAHPQVDQVIPLRKICTSVYKCKYIR